MLSFQRDPSGSRMGCSRPSLASLGNTELIGGSVMGIRQQMGAMWKLWQFFVDGLRFAGGDEA